LFIQPKVVENQEEHPTNEKHDIDKKKDLPKRRKDYK
jgi:hypothetical protein